MLLAFTLIVGGNVIAQGLGDGVVITSQTEGTRNIKPSSKIATEPTLILDTTKKQLKMNYVFYEYMAPSEFTVDTIKPAKVKIIDPLDRLKRGYLKAGIGMYLTPLVELHYGSERSRHNNWGINYNHFSSHQAVSKDFGYSGLSQNHADVFYKHFLDHMSIRGDLYYDRDVNYFYGFNTSDTSIDRDIIKQRFQTIGGKARIASYLQDIPEFNYNGEIGFRNYRDSNRANENKFNIGGRVQTIIDEELYGIDGELLINSYNATVNTPLIPDSTFVSTDRRQTNGVLKLAPHVITNRDRLKARVGLDIAIDMGSSTGFHFYPNAEFKYSFHDIFIPYVGVNGNLKQNTFYSLTQENPFMLSSVELKNTNTKYNVYGGVRGSISNKTSFNLSASKSRVVDMPLYFSDTTYSIGNRFDVVYDTLDIFNITGQLSYKLGDKLNVFGKAEYNMYSTVNQAYAWNLSPIEVTLGGIYDLQDKIIVRGDIFFVGNRNAKVLDTTINDVQKEGSDYFVQLKPFVDFNLGFEYRYTKRFSLFLNFNNIISQRYRRYYQYPNQGLNIMGGLTVDF